MGMKHHFASMIIFTHPETGEDYYVNYRGYHIKDVIKADPYNSSPGETYLTLIDFPAQLQDWEDIIRDTIIEHELQ